MRTKLAIKNMLTSFLLQVVTAVSGLLIPRFFISQYGSTVNGLVSSISQFIVYMGLVEAGISAAATVNLYKPLSEKCYPKINAILSAARIFYRKSGVLFFILLGLLTIIYPIIVSNGALDSFYIRTMITALSFNSIIDYFILGKYRVLLIADQRSYVISISQMVGVFITTIVSIILINLEFSAITVKTTVSLVYLLRTWYIVHYAKKHYPFLDFHQKPDTESFSQRKNALLHQIAGLICNNTDVVLLTVMLGESGLILVSIYSLYNLVAYAITNLFESFALGIRSSFGQLIAEGNQNNLKEVYSLFEFVYITILFTVYCCVSLLLYPFITLYSESFTDSLAYPNWTYTILFSTIGLIQNLRIPGSTVHVAAGHFKETQVAAVIEASINLIVSLCLVSTLGISGVLLGTLASYLFRTSYIIWYTDNKFIAGSLWLTVIRVLRSLIVSVAIIIISKDFIRDFIVSWVNWTLAGVSLFIVAITLIVGINIIFEPYSVHNLLKRIKS